MEIIDTHQHLWDRSLFHLPWLDSATPPLSNDHLPSDYLVSAQGLGITKTIYMEVDVAPEQRVAEAAYVYALCADPKNPMVGAVVGGDPSMARFPDYLDQIASPYLKGVRTVLHGGTPSGYCLSADFVAGIRVLGARNLCFDLCLRPDGLSDGTALARLCPETRLVLDHCGNAPVQGTMAQIDVWKRGLEAVASCPNVVVKISGIVAFCDPAQPLVDQLAPFVDFTLDTFGPERVLFASDWPVCTLVASLRDWVSACRTIVATRSAEDQNKLFFENAIKFYGL